MQIGKEYASSYKKERQMWLQMANEDPRVHRRGFVEEYNKTVMQRTRVQKELLKFLVYAGHLPPP